MKRYALAIIMLLGVSVLCGNTLTNTMFPDSAVHVRGPTVVEQAVQDALTPAENQLIDLGLVAEQQFRNPFSDNTITPADGEKFINAADELYRLKSALDLPLTCSFGTETDLSSEVRFVAIAYNEIRESTNLVTDMEQTVTVFLNSLTGSDITISDSDSGEDDRTQASLAEVDGNELEVARHMYAHY